MQGIEIGAGILKLMNFSAGMSLMVNVISSNLGSYCQLSITEMRYRQKFFHFKFQNKPLLNDCFIFTLEFVQLTVRSWMSTNSSSPSKISSGLCNVNKMELIDSPLDLGDFNHMIAINEIFLRGLDCQNQIDIVHWKIS